MKRSPMPPRTAPMKRMPLVTKPAASGKPAPRAKMKPKKIPPTAEESRWMDAVAALGCIVCLKHHQAQTPAAVHHIVEGSRRLGHFYTIPLCDPGHHQNSPTSQKLSRHPHKTRFEKKYGTEYELLEYVQTLLNWNPI